MLVLLGLLQEAQWAEVFRNTSLCSSLLGMLHQFSDFFLLLALFNG